MGKSSPPPPPDPKETAAAQTGTNISTAIANNVMGFANQNTPTGSQSSEISGYYSLTDPSTGETYQIPMWTHNTSLNEGEQAVYDSGLEARGNLAGLAAERSDWLADYLPQTGAMTDEIDSKLFDLGSKRLDPRFEREEAALRTQLANQGIAPGSEAYNKELDLFRQGKNDAYNQLTLTGRNTAMNEVNAPINQITALLSGGQVSGPGTTGPMPGASIPTTDYAGIVNQNYNQQMNNWQTQQGQRSSLMGGLFGAGAKVLSGGIW